MRKKEKTDDNVKTNKRWSEQGFERSSSHEISHRAENVLKSVRDFTDNIYESTED